MKCCVCQETGKPGQLDPETKECLCECECQAPDGSKVPSFKVNITNQSETVCKTEEYSHRAHSSKYLKGVTF